jgi:hypothetical protein
MRGQSYPPEPNPKSLPLASPAVAPSAAAMQGYQSFLHAQGQAPEHRLSSHSNKSPAMDGVHRLVPLVSPPPTSVSSMSATVVDSQPVAAKARLRRSKLERQVIAARAVLIDSQAHLGQGSSPGAGRSHHTSSTSVDNESTAQQRVQQLEMELEELRARTGGTALPAYAPGGADMEPPTPVVVSKPPRLE